MIATPDTTTQIRTTSGTPRLRHILEKGPDGKPSDKCLCGYLWDIFPIKHDPEAGICEKCVAEYERREGGRS